MFCLCAYPRVAPVPGLSPYFWILFVWASVYWTCPGFMDFVCFCLDFPAAFSDLAFLLLFSHTFIVWIKLCYCEKRLLLSFQSHLCSIHFLWLQPWPHQQNSRSMFSLSSLPSNLDVACMTQTPWEKARNDYTSNMSACLSFRSLLISTLLTES